MNLLAILRSIVGKRGLNPGDYRQTLREASLKRWGNASLIRRGGYGIDEVFAEFQASYPWVFDDIEDFVEALADCLSGRSDGYDSEDYHRIAEEIQHEEYYSEDGKPEILLKLQSGKAERTLKREYTGKAIETLTNEGLVKKVDGKMALSEKGIRRILEIALERRIERRIK